MQEFIKFCNFYRRFIKDFFKIEQFIIKLIKKNVVFYSSEACQKSFKLLKTIITSTFVLYHYVKEKKTILKIDFSNYVNEEVLSQYDDNKFLHSIAFYSKNMLSVECNYEIYDKKFLTIIKCLKH